MATKTDHPLERMVFFSDAVFAIAITLLVIELHPPDLPRDASDLAHWRALAEIGPSFYGYAISFWVIGAFWMGHHRVFALSAHYHPKILKWNMGLLWTIAFMPFVTNYMSLNMGARVPVTIYCVEMFLAAVCNMMVNRTATSPPMVDEAAPPEAIAYVRQRGQVMVLGTACAVGVCFVAPAFGQFGLLSIPLWRILLKRWNARRGIRTMPI
jgi:uncharacterized membrane protein